MQGKIVVLFLLVILATMADAAKITLKDGTGIASKTITYKDGVFRTDDGQEISREEVKQSAIVSAENEGVVTDARYALTPEKIASWRKISDDMQKTYPEANGIIIDEVSRYGLTTDGRIMEEAYYTVKIVTQDAKGFARLSFYVEEEQNRIKILYARSISPDGEIFNYSEDDISYSEPSRDMLFFGKGTIMSLSLPEADTGYIIDIGYIKEEFKPEDIELFRPWEAFQYDEPIARKKLEIYVPKKRELYYLSQHLTSRFTEDYVTNLPDTKLKERPDAIKPVITTDDTSKFYVWEMTNIEPIVLEPNMPSYFNIAPYIFSGLHKDYTYYYKRFGDLEREHMKLTPELDSLARL